MKWLARAEEGVAFIHAFFEESSALKKRLSDYRGIMAPDGVIWVSWPKKASGVRTDITEDTVRRHALPLGLVWLAMSVALDQRRAD